MKVILLKVIPYFYRTPLKRKTKHMALDEFQHPAPENRNSNIESKYRQLNFRNLFCGYSSLEIQIRTTRKAVWEMRIWRT
jgi:hypothetical protein